jgi:TP901 family phage tail tape measure protein
MASGKKSYALDIAIGATLKDSFSSAIKSALGQLSKMGTKGKIAAGVISGSLTGSAVMATAAFKATAKAIELTSEVCVKAVESAGQFEKQMANVSTLLDGTTEEIDARTSELSASVLEVSNATGVATSDLSDGLYQVISAFGDTAESAEIMEIAAKSGAAGCATTTDAVNLLSAVTKAYGDTSAEANQRVSDMAFQTVKLGQTSYAELASSIQQVTSLSSAMGVSQEELFGVFAAGTGVVGSASEVATKLKAVYTKLQKPTQEMATAMEEMGYASGEAMIADLGLQGTMEAITKYSEKTGKSLASLYGSSNAAVLATAMTGDLSGALTDKTAAMGKADGATDAAFARQTQTFEYSLQMLKNMGNNALTELGQKLLPYLTQLGTDLLPVVSSSIDTLLDAVDELGPVISEIFENIDLGMIAEMASGILPVIVEFINQILPIINQLMPPLMEFATQVLAALLPALTTLIQNLLPVLLPLLTPILSIITSLLPVIVTLTNIITPIINIIVSGVQLILSVLSAVMPIISGIITVVGNVVGIIATAVQTLVSAISGALGGMFDWLSEKIKTGVNFIIRCINAVINAINGIHIGPLPNWKVLGEYAGAEIGFNLATIPEMATGGIVTQDTLARIGEGSEPEAVIPLSKLSTMLDGGIGGEINVTFAPVINCENGDPYEIKNAVNDSFEQFKIYMQRYQKENGRLSFSRA